MKRRYALPGYAVGIALVAFGGLSVAQGAAAVDTIDNGEPGMLWLESSPLPEWTEAMEPGDVAHWPVTTMLSVDATGDLSLELEHSGALASDADGLRLRLERCDEPWEGETCAPGAELIEDGALAGIPSNSLYDLGQIPGGDRGPYFLLTLSLPEVMPVELQGQQADLALGFTAFGDTASITVPGSLPNTGVNVSGGIAVAAGLVIAGLVFARQRATAGSS